MTRLLVLFLFCAAAFGQAPIKTVRSFPNPQGANYASGLAFQNGQIWAAGDGSAIWRYW